MNDCHLNVSPVTILILILILTSSQNMGRFGPVLVRPCRFDLILGVSRFSRKRESFTPYATSF